MHAGRGFRHHLLVVGSGGDRVERVVDKDNRIETSNNLLQQVSEEDVASSGTEEPEKTTFEDRLCRLQEQWCHGIRFETLHLPRLPTPFRKQKVQRIGTKKLQVSRLWAFGMHTMQED